MEAERWRRIEALFHRAAALQAHEREEFLSTQCHGDPELRRELEGLLASDVAEGDAFSRVESRPPRAGADPLVGRVLGVYRLTERIATGGMGVVYRGERTDGLFEQAVAVKLIRAERATDWMLRRFEFERRTLAALQHPSIARLYDGGTTDEGHPYFVMELVRGEPIDRHCEATRATLSERLRLFVQVCRAVQFAHQNLVVHCDLKPANILIDERGAPHLLDFGIARLLEDAPDASAPGANATIARVLTPEYASPEQLAGTAITTSIDVYSLGVVLYELLTGRRPFQTESRGPAEWERLIRERAPDRPSTIVRRASDGAELERLSVATRSSPKALQRALRGDLDRIVLMALRKEPERRYASAQELADDIERHLAGEPVHARDNSVAYLAAKFVRRHRVGVAASVAVLAALIAGLVASRRAESVAIAEARHARMEADGFESISGFLMDAFLPVQPSQDQAWQAQARERIVAHAERVRRQYADDPHGRANMLDALAGVGQRLELFDDARELANEALSIREATFGANSLETARSLRQRGQIEYAAGQFASAADWLGRALELQRAAGESLHADVAGAANDLAACWNALGRFEDAERLHREALERRRALGDGSLAVAESLNNLAAVHGNLARLDEAVADLRESLSIRRSILGDEHALTLQTSSNLATILWRQGARDEGLAMLAETEAGYRKLGGDGESELAVTLANHSVMQLAVGDLDGAASSLNEALELQSRRLGDEHPRLAASLVKLALVEHARKRDERALELWGRILRIRRAPNGAPRDLGEALYGFSVFRLDRGELDLAEQLVREALDVQRSQDPLDRVACGRSEYVLATCLERRDELTAAREHFEEALHLLESAPSETAEERARVERHLRELDSASGR